MIQINLIPDVKKELIRAEVQRNFIISIAILSAIIAAAVVVLVASYVYGAQALMVRSANGTIDSEYSKLTSVEDLDKMLTIQNQLASVSSLEQKKNMTSRLYDMLNVVVPESPHEVSISSVTVEPPKEEVVEENADEEAAEEAQAAIPKDGPVITIEGQTAGGYASLEVFEKMIASAVIEYNTNEGVGETGEFSCSNDGKQCRWLVVGGGDRSTAVNVTEMNFGEDQNGARTLFFQLSFTAVPELMSNAVNNLGIKIGQDGNVTDSYLGVPRAIFESRPAAKGDE